MQCSECKRYWHVGGGTLQRRLSVRAQLHVSVKLKREYSPCGGLT